MLQTSSNKQNSISNGSIRVSISVQLIFNMAGSVKTFQFVQKFHQTIGIYPSHPIQKQWSINWSNTMMLICMAQQTLTSFVYLATEANSMFE